MLNLINDYFSLLLLLINLLEQASEHFKTGCSYFMRIFKNVVGYFCVHTFSKTIKSYFWRKGSFEFKNELCGYFNYNLKPNLIYNVISTYLPPILGCDTVAKECFVAKECCVKQAWPE